MSLSVGPARFSVSIAPVQRHEPRVRTDEDALTVAIIALARRFGRYGYRRITDVLRGPAVAGRWFLHQVATRARKSCLGL